ncbi:arabinan endo-1,5-alpha-L-arabinosidase [Segetibacter sp.]|jgi:arabinan endo-1,5-alpha-L-arabinosidase|uniref:arabinan endo-1,5-alpha-L-arabinosidase n=1 Tax=Segetibacter sp. TaxID=2231182 RepID=UPI0026075290|nr:arabinan endo-1,5-alpha-L-arabinosidase [Segetibacter sp.]MCW3080594.1 arabinan endo,5-alpha-L-arabinosidase [Segetibacter sp.]
MKGFTGVFVLLFWASCLYAQQVDIKIPAHDPVMIKQGDTYYLFCTGFGITVYSSNDMKTWKRRKSVFSKPPDWAVKAVPGFRGHVWAPDISFHNGKYYLYYAVSAFGKNTSCIGVAVNNTLDSASADYEWKDLGKVIQSVPGRDLWNAIDPNLIVDEDNTPWLVFGSFWEGMKLVKLNADLATVAQPEVWRTVARRQRNFSVTDSSAGDAAIEGPFIFKKDKYYYLFVSWDYCCRAEKSDYKVVVGRSERVTGPYIDKTGKSMVMGGGSLVLEGDNKLWYGAGHNSAYTFNEKDYIIYHGYDAQDKGRSKLMIRELNWSDGWPKVAVQ